MKDYSSDFLVLIMGVGLITLILSFIGVSSQLSHMGQMICDEQYGKDNTTYQPALFFDATVTCKKLPPSKPYDGGKTRLIGDDV